MNKLTNRQYHECLNYIDLEIPQAIKYGNELLDRIPFNQIEQNEEIEKLDIEELIPKLNLNLPEGNLKLMEKYFIEEKDHISLTELLKTQEPYNKLDPILLYYYCRELVGNPVKGVEKKRIKNDIKVLKKATKQIEKNRVKFETRKSTIEFL
tara:strand:+ start:587 stop:1042 length:456 start_codon:yes stop_codon:yes gene_type:complete